MTGGRDAVFTGPSGCPSLVPPPGGWASRTDGLPACLARRRRGTARKGARPTGCRYAGGVRLRRPHRAAPAQRVLLCSPSGQRALGVYCIRVRGGGDRSILSSAGFLRRANQVAVAASASC